MTIDIKVPERILNAPHVDIETGELTKSGKYILDKMMKQLNKRKMAKKKKRKSKETDKGCLREKHQN
jgi:hypothetical protein